MQLWEGFKEGIETITFSPLFVGSGGATGQEICFSGQVKHFQSPFRRVWWCNKPADKLLKQVLGAFSPLFVGSGGATCLEGYDARAVGAFQSPFRRVWWCNLAILLGILRPYIFQSPFRRVWWCNWRPTNLSVSFSVLSVPFSSGLVVQLGWTWRRGVQTDGFQSPFRRVWWCNGAIPARSTSGMPLSVPFSSGLVVQLPSWRRRACSSSLSVPFSSGLVVQHRTSRPTGYRWPRSFSPLFVGSGGATIVNLPRQRIARLFQSPFRRVWWCNLLRCRRLVTGFALSVPFSSGLVVQLCWRT